LGWFFWWFWWRVKDPHFIAVTIFDDGRLLLFGLLCSIPLPKVFLDAGAGRVGLARIGSWFPMFLLALAGLADSLLLVEASLASRLAELGMEDV